MPKKAATHIQNTAPGPPMQMAAATPAMLPTPMVAASAVHSAWKGDMALPSLLWESTSRLNMLPMVFFHQSFMRVS